MRWRRRGALIGTIGAASLLAWPASVGAAGAPTGECPTAAWQLLPAPGGGQGVPSADVNGNGLSCWLEAPEGSGIFTIMDDVVRAPHA